MKPRNHLTHYKASDAAKFWTALAIAIASLFMTSVGGSTTFAMQGSEYEIKGAMILNFIRFVEWPSANFTGPDQALVIGVLGNNDFRDAFSPIEGRVVSGKRLSVRYLDSIPQARDCHVLFVSRYQTYRISQILKTLDNTPILTIGEVEEFTDLGGMIRFYWKNRNIHFEINKTAVTKAKLHVSAKLFEIARVVH